MLHTTHTEIEEVDNKIRQTIHMRAIAYRKDGNLRRSNHNWRDDLVIDEAQMIVRVLGDRCHICPTRDEQRFVEIGVAEGKVGTRWEKNVLGNLKKDKHELSWSSKHGKVSCEFGGHFVTWNDIVLDTKKLPSNNELRFPVNVQGLEINNLQFLQDNLPVLNLRQMTVMDLDNQMDVRQVDTQLVQIDGQWYILAKLPSLAGMTTPVVDPTIVLQPGAADGKDALINSFSGSTPPLNTRNYGTYLYILDTSYTRGLIQFDVSALPSSATVTAATMTICQANSGAAVGFTVQAYSIASGNATWPEGTKSNALGIAGDCCWLYKEQTPGAETAWAGGAGLSTSGTDYESALLGSVAGNRSDPNGTPYVVTLATARVQNWVGTPNTNYGLLLLGGSVGGIASSDHLTAAYRPQLTVVYTLPQGVVSNSSFARTFHPVCRGAFG